MRSLPLAAILVALLLSPASPQEAPDPPTPDLGTVAEAVDGTAGTVVPPALRLAYGALGQNITREDVRIMASLNVTKGTVDGVQVLLGAVQAEVQAHVRLRVEMRVLSSERIRALVEGENAYNVSAENATWMSEAFLPAEVFRATATAQLVALFQAEQERALVAFLQRSVPEMQILSLDLRWHNVSPQQALTDFSLTEPPIVVELEATLQYLHHNTMASMLADYLRGRDEPDRDDRKAYIDRLKQDNGDPLRSRDFFAAAAYTQLLNLSMQPGWSLSIALHVPKGYAFTYVNGNITERGERSILLEVDAMDVNQGIDHVFLASITHKRAIALALFATMWLAGLLLAMPARVLRWRQVRRRAAAGDEPLAQDT